MDQLVNAVWGDNSYLFWEPSETYKTLSGKNAEFLNVKASDTYSNYCAIKD
jgi:hypothetical protein